MRYFFLTCVLCGLSFLTSGQPNNQSGTIKEEFWKFLEKFSMDDKFQNERIKFPLVHVSYDESLTKLRTSYIKKGEWKVSYFCFEPDRESYTQVYDNFDHVLRDTDERIFAWHGIGNGIKKFLYFKRINGRWYLIKEEDLST